MNDVVGSVIIDKIIDSTTWVHKADLDYDGKITESDYGEQTRIMASAG